MKRFSVRFNFAVWSFVFLALLSGCYEGYKKPNQGQTDGNQKGGGGGGSGSKPYGFALIDVIKPNGEALVSPTCGRVPTSLSGVRMNEIERRARSVIEVINSIADSVTVHPLDIDSANCQSFASLQARAAEALPNGSIPEELKAKPALHVRLVVWFGDPSASYPANVIINNEWASFQKLGRDGFNRRISVNHFALVGPTYGYIWNWKTISDPNLNFLATTLSNPAPTPEGISELTKVILKSAMDFANWLRERTGTTL